MDRVASTKRDVLERMLFDESVDPTDLPLSLLEYITNGFSEDKQIGRGGFSVVYKGMLSNGTIAVKKLFDTHLHENEFHKEVACLMKAKHKNVVRFFGYCANTQGRMESYNGKHVMADVQQRLLCFEYLPKGSLHDYITDASHELEWTQYYQIIKGICTGLHYLHKNHIVHLDLKPSNILLDDNMVPKIADFGLSRCFDENQSHVITSKRIGSRGYLAPEFDCGRIGFKSDIYSLGVIITEILTGEKICPEDYDVLECWGNRLEQLYREKQLEQLRVCAEIGKECTEYDPRRRPDALTIVHRLDEVDIADRSIVTEMRNLSIQQAEQHGDGRKCGLQAYLPESSGGQQQLVEYYYYSEASQHTGPSEEAQGSAEAIDGHNRATENSCADHVVVDLQNGEAKISNDSYARCVVKQVGGEFKNYMDLTEERMHRYPACLGGVDKCYTMPRIVAIGPYHHGQDHLKEAEMVKHAAAGDFVKRWGCLLEELYEAVASTADKVRHLYDKDAMAAAGIRDDNDFRSMMFFDACFLVQYMVMEAGSDEIDESLRGFLNPNRMDIFHDVMLLENQLPWKVVQTVMSFMPMSTIPEDFARSMRSCMLPHHSEPLQKPFVWYDSYNPPHLLGLLRYYVVGRSNDIKYEPTKPKNMSAMKLATIGIKLAANKTMELIDMRLNQGAIFAKLSLAPLTLDSNIASLLVSMAALELCTVESFSKAKGDEDSAVCSYLTLLSMLIHREEDVHKLRERDILQGGRGLTNEEALRFFTSLQGMRFGPSYYHLMRHILSSITR